MPAKNWTSGLQFRVGVISKPGAVLVDLSQPNIFRDCLGAGRREAPVQMTSGAVNRHGLRREERDSKGKETVGFVPFGPRYEILFTAV